jgi:AraC family transcriptional regulator, exoenzyme S synthesis regulatory protein ExsA
MLNTFDDSVFYPDAFKQLSVRDLLFVYFKWPQVARFQQLSNHYNQFTFSLKGERILHQGENSWKVTPQTSYFQRKTAYVHEVLDSKGWEVLVFHIPDEFLIQFANEFLDNLSVERLPELTTDMFIKIDVSEMTRTYFYSMLPYFTQQVPPSEKLLELKFKELLLNILSNPSNIQLLTYILHLSDDIKTPVWQIMEKNYTYNLTLKDFARISSRSLAAFKRDFFEYYQTTPGKWLTNKRLNHAGMLLRTTNQSISEIAFNSGFENISHFSRIFKENFGLSPLQFRKSQSTLA